MASIGALSVEITADNTSLNRGLRESEGRLSSFSANARQTVQRLALLGTAAAAAGAAFAAHLVRNGAQAIDKQAKVARSLDGTIDGLRGYTEAAEDAGISTAEAAREAQTLTGRLAEAARRGAGPAAEAMQRLGLDAKALMNMDIDQRMAAIADAMRAKGMSAAQARDELRQLGVRNREMATLMVQGGDAIRAARQEVDDFGLSISEVDAAQVEAANDAMRRISRTFEVLRNQLTIGLAPYLEVIANRINDAARESGGFRDQLANAVEFGIRGVARVADVIESLRRTFVVLGQATAVGWHAMRLGALEVAEAIINWPTRATNDLISLMNRLPGIKIADMGFTGFGQRLADEVTLARVAVDEGLASIHETLMRPLPTAAVEEYLQEVRNAAAERAQQTIDSRERVAEIELEHDEEDLEREREHQAQRRELLREALGWELDFMREAQDAMSAINEAGERERSEQIGRFARANRAIRENAIRGEAAELEAGLRAMFGDHKIFSESMGHLKRAEAVMSAYAWGASQGGPLAGAAAAAAAGAAQLSGIRALRGVTFGGGSAAAPAAGAAAPAAGGGGGQDSITNVRMTLVGQTFGVDQVEQAVSQLLSDNGGRIGSFKVERA